MNPLTKIKNTQKITAREVAAGVSDEGSWHAKYRNSAYVYVGGIPFELTEGDLLAVFAQYGEIVDANLVRDKASGKSRGFAFLAYEDQRSTVLAVDNLNGARVGGRIVRVDHVENYKRKLQEEEEEEEERRKKREENGVCYAFQRGECNRGSSCKFSHDEERNANTGWGSRYDEDGAEKTKKGKKYSKEADRSQRGMPSHQGSLPRQQSPPHVKSSAHASSDTDANLIHSHASSNPWEGRIFSILSNPSVNDIERGKRKKDEREGRSGKGEKEKEMKEKEMKEAYGIKRDGKLWEKGEVERSERRKENREGNGERLRDERDVGGKRGRESGEGDEMEYKDERKRMYGRDERKESKRKDNQMEENGRREDLNGKGEREERKRDGKRERGEERSRDDRREKDDRH